MRTRAADDFEFIRSRMEQLKRERQPAPVQPTSPPASSRSGRRTRVELGWLLLGVHVPNVTSAHCDAPVVNCEFACDRCREKQP
jgi:hypothetical protein